MTEQASAKEVNEFHQKDDLDSSHRAHHHTLGFGPNQASPGNHTHDGTTSPAIDTGVMTITSVDASIDVTGPDVSGNVDLSVANIANGLYEDDDFVVLAGAGTVVHTLSHTPVPETLNIYWNGVRLQTNEFTRVADEVTIPDPNSRFAANDEIWFWYKYAGMGSGEPIPQQFYVGGTEPSPAAVPIIWLDEISTDLYEMKLVL